MKALQFLIFIICTYTNINAKAQGKPYVLKYNRIDYYAPASPNLPAENKTMNLDSKFIIDIEKNFVEILVFYSDGPVKSKYEIKEFSDIKESKEGGKYFTLKCQGNNLATVVIDVNKQVRWIKRTIPHNGIVHKFYNNDE
ncbi:hypothetical protein [Chitinophaga cymbidii]|uniref:Uncharacterized protein n=1 Tax=Chitinophaga cymbidii TaxID=1096750 RepID=A0A512RKE8_9BACT|nr:hypothetical protein [Chitinophaga cymbidii]GEP96152.1 hypothetical protein CCY01nite_24120 [Chitinophaga cymbidii]